MGSGSPNVLNHNRIGYLTVSGTATGWAVFDPRKQEKQVNEEHSKQAEETTEYTLVLADVGMGRQDDPALNKYLDSAATLGKTALSDSLYGVVPATGDPEDNYTGTAGLVGDLLDSGHGYKVDTRPEGRKESRTHCQRCGEQLLFQIKPCLGYNPQWMPKGEKRMIGTPETDGSPLLWWSNDRLGCQCLNCKSLTKYMENRRVPATRKFCTDTCRKASSKRYQAEKRRELKDRRMVALDEIETVRIQRKPRLRSGIWGTDAVLGAIYPNY
jgi:hypothetical protein